MIVINHHRHHLGDLKISLPHILLISHPLIFDNLAIRPQTFYPHLITHLPITKSHRIQKLGQNIFLAHLIKIKLLFIPLPFITKYSTLVIPFHLISRIRMHLHKIGQWQWELVQGRRWNIRTCGMKDTHAMTDFLKLFPLENTSLVLPHCIQLNVIQSQIAMFQLTRIDSLLEISGPPRKFGLLGFAFYSLVCAGLTGVSSGTAAAMV